MKKTSFLKKLTAMAATLAMTCVMAVGAFAAEPTVDYKLDSASIHVGETWTMEVPAGNIYDWNLSSEYIAFGPSMADKEGVLKQVGYETANGVSTITYEAMMPGTCTVTLTDRSFAQVAEATVTVTDGSATPDTPSVDTPSTDNKAAETSAAAAVSTAPVDTRTAQQREIDEAKANGTWGIEYTTCQKCGYHNWTRKGNVYVCDTCGNETTTVVSANGVKGYVNSAYVTTTKSDGGSKPSGSIGETIVATAKQYMGAPYVYGGMSPSGFDCSGFVNYVYKLCGYSMSRVASSIYNNNGTYVEKANLQLGDLVFFASNSSSIGHVGIYIGNGQFIHSSSGAGCVVISDLSSSYYLKNYVGAKRIAG